MRFRPEDIYAFLLEEGCTYEGDRIPNGQAWLTPTLQVFFLPDPDFEDGEYWFDAFVLIDNLKDRWAGFEIPPTIRTYK